MYLSRDHRLLSSSCQLDHLREILSAGTDLLNVRYGCTLIALLDCGFPNVSTTLYGAGLFVF